MKRVEVVVDAFTSSCDKFYWLRRCNRTSFVKPGQMIGIGTPVTTVRTLVAHLQCLCYCVVRGCGAMVPLKRASQSQEMVFMT